MRKGFLLIMSFVCLFFSCVIWGLGIWKEKLHPLALDFNSSSIALDPLPAPSIAHPVLKTASPSALALSAQGVIALDLASETILFTKNEHTPFYPASTVKIMTALVVRDQFPLDDLVTLTSSDLTISNSIGLQVGETLTVADLLQALLISSSNEAAQALASHHPQGMTAFVDLMNAKADELNLTTAHFISPEGFDNTEQKISAFDLLILSRALLQDDYLRSIVALDQTTISNTSGRLYHLINTNQLFDAHTIIQTADQSFQPEVYGIKTGTTPLALEALSSFIRLDSHDFLIVVLESKTRYNDTVSLLSWLMNNYEWHLASPHQPN